MNAPRFNPFPGLRPFRTDEKYLFFGREEQTAELLRRLRQTRFLAVVGTSGSGKSSLVQAGLLPELHGGMMRDAGSHWEIAVMRPGGNPLTHLARTLVAADLYDEERGDAVLEVRATLSRSGLGLVEAVRQSNLATGSNLLLVVDQFEEIFRFRRSRAANMEEATAFVNLLLEASRSVDVPVYVVLTMRSDYLGDCSEFPGFAEAVNRGEYLIPRMSRDQKRAAIHGPVKVAGGTIAPRLLQKLLNDVGDNPDHLPVLQHALMRTWEAWERDHSAGEPIDLRHYASVGGMAEALSRHADEVYAELPDDRHRVVAKRMFKALTERSHDNRGIRRPGRIRKLCAVADADEETLGAVVETFRRFGRTFLMPPEGTPLSSDTVIDISHESLMRAWRRLDAWVEEESQSARVYRRLSDTAALHADGRAGLYHDPDLHIAMTWRAREHPNEAWADQYGGRFEQAMTFLEASNTTVRREEREKQAARERELAQARELAQSQSRAARNFRRFAAALGVGLVAAVAVSIWALRLKRTADAAETRAREAAGALTESLVQGDFDVANDKLEAGDTPAGLAYLARAMRTDPDFTPAGMRALSTLSGGMLPVRRFAPIERATVVEWIAVNQKHDLLLVTADDARDVSLWDMESGVERRRILPGIKPLSGLRSSVPTDGAPLKTTADALWPRFHDAPRIWWANDPAENPPADRPRWFSRTIPIPTGRTVAGADIFITADNRFTLSVNGTEIGSGDQSKTVYHADITPSAASRELVLGVVAINDPYDGNNPAALVAALALRLDDGTTTIVTTDSQWGSSDSSTGPREPSREFDASKFWFITDRGRLMQAQWSADSNRLIAHCPDENKIRAWDVTTGEPVGTPATTGDPPSPGSPAAPPIQVGVSAYDEQGDLVIFENSKDSSLHVWNLTKGQEQIPPLKAGGSDQTWTLSADGRRIAASFPDSTIRVLDLTDGAVLDEFQTRPARAQSVVFSRDGTHLVVVDDPRTGPADQPQRFLVRNLGAGGEPAPVEWRALSLKPVATTTFPPGVAMVSFIGAPPTPLNGFAAETFDLATGAKVAELTSDQPGMGNLYRLASDYGIVTLVEMNMVRVLDLRTGKQIQRLVAPSLLSTATLMPDGRGLVGGSAVGDDNFVGGSREKQLFLFDLLTGRQRLPRPLVAEGDVKLAFAPSEEMVVAGDVVANRVHFWDTRTGRAVRAPLTLSNLDQILFNRSGSRIALLQRAETTIGNEFIGQTTGRVYLHQIGPSPAIPFSLADARAESSGVAVMARANGRGWITLTKSTGGQGLVGRTWESEAGALQMSGQFEATRAFGNNPSLARDRFIAFGTSGRPATVWDAGSGRPLHEFVSDAGIASIHLCANGLMAAAGGNRGVVQIWSEAAGESVLEPFKDTDSIDRIRSNASGSLMAVVNFAKKRRFAVIEIPSGRLVAGPMTTVNAVEDVVFTKDDRFAVVSANDFRVLVVDLLSGKSVRSFELTDWSRGLDLSPDGRTLAVGSGGYVHEAQRGQAYLFDFESGTQRTPPLEVEGTVWHVRFSPDGRILATGTISNASGDGYVRLWDTATGFPLSGPVSERGDVLSMSFQPDGSALGVAWSNGAIRVLPVPPRDRIPEWMPDVVEAVAGKRLGDGGLEDVDNDRLEAVRRRFDSASPEAAGSAHEAGWTGWARWLFADPATRSVAPGAPVGTAEELMRLSRSEVEDDLVRAVRLAPQQALAWARLGLLHGSSTSTSEPPSHHAQDTAVHRSNRAIELEPENAEVWALRAELMRRLKRDREAVAAADKAVALVRAAKEAVPIPGVLHQLAVVYAGVGEWEKAGAAFENALVQLSEHQRRTAAGEHLPELSGAVSRLLRPRSEEAPAATVPALPDPVPGAFEDFEEVVTGRLPPGWRVWNRSDPHSREGVGNLGSRSSDAWLDWLVLSGSDLHGAHKEDHRDLVGRIRATPTTPMVNGRAVPFMVSRMALASSLGRRGNGVQFLESPDFNCSGQSSIHLVFHSAWDHVNRAMCLIEYSIDGGDHWLPARYWVDRAALPAAWRAVRDKTEAAGEAAETIEAFLGRPNKELPRWIDATGAVAGGSYGAFVSAPHSPDLAGFFEGRAPYPAGVEDHWKRIESIQLPQADGQPRVRLRFGKADFFEWYWAIDNVGLYPIPEAEVAKAAASTTESIGDDALALVRLAWSLLGAKKFTSHTVPSQEFLSAIMPGILRGEPLSDTTFAVQPQPEARLLIERALHLAPDSPEVRAFAAMPLALLGETARAETLLRAFGADETAGEDPRLRWTAGFLALQRALDASRTGDGPGARALLEVAHAFLDDSGGPLNRILQQADRLDGGAVAAGSARVLLPQGSNWRYHDQGSLPAPNWAAPDFDDWPWPSGKARLGYGGDGEVTTVGFGPDERAKFPTTYFRTTFEIADPSPLRQLRARIQRDDGVVVYLNGSEIVRDVLPDGPVSYDTLATRVANNVAETDFHDFPVPASNLVTGRNVIAAEVHQAEFTSTDLGFDLELLDATRRAGTRVEVADFSARMESAGLPVWIRRDCLRWKADQLAAEGLWAEALAAERTAGSEDDRPEAMRLEALAAEAAGRDEEGYVLFCRIIDRMRSLRENRTFIPHHHCAESLLALALMTRDEPADLAYAMLRAARSTMPQAEQRWWLRLVRERVPSRDLTARGCLVEALIALKRYDEALREIDAVLGVLGEPGAEASPATVAEHRAWLRRRESALRVAGKRTEANELLTRILTPPPRNPNLPAKLIDLTPYYNASLFDSRGWSYAIPTGISNANLAVLPRTFRPLHGIDFDLRGIVQLESGVIAGDGRTFNQRENLRHPLRVEGIRIEQTTPAIHFLLATQWDREREGVEVARFVIHYADGKDESCAVRHGLDVEDYYPFPIGGSSRVPADKLAWRGFNENEVNCELSRFTWSNPHPAETIDHVDFISAEVQAAPFLVAITLE